VSNHTVLIPSIADDTVAELEADFLQIEGSWPRIESVVTPEIPWAGGGADPDLPDYPRGVTRMTGSRRCCGGG
jgi:hypothetical protein